MDASVQSAQGRIGCFDLPRKALPSLPKAKGMNLPPVRLSDCACLSALAGPVGARVDFFDWLAEFREFMDWQATEFWCPSQGWNRASSFISTPTGSEDVLKPYIQYL